MKFKSAQMTPEDKALYSVMAEYTLKPGQALFLGPKSVAALTGEVEFTGRLPDKFMMQKRDGVYQLC